MVSHHLHVVFSVCFSIKDENLVDPECALGEVVDFERAGKRIVWETDPEIVQIPRRSRE